RRAKRGGAVAFTDEVLRRPRVVTEPGEVPPVEWTVMVAVHPHDPGAMTAWDRAKQDRVNDREDRGVRGNTKGDRERSDDGERRASPELSHGEANIGGQRVECRDARTTQVIRAIHLIHP